MVVPGRPSACWTCKLRHVSCDKGAPACSECVFRSITCHGYGKSSPWANDRRSEQREKQVIKQAVKKHVRQQMFHRNNNKSQAGQGPAQPSVVAESPSPPAPSPPGRARDEGCFSQPSGSSDSLSYSECSLLMHYFDQVFPIQYPGYTSNTGAGRGWMLWLLQKNSALAKAALGLASLHRRYTSGKEDVSNVELEYLARVLRDLQDSISRWNVPHSDMPHDVLVEIIACSANLVSFEVLRGSIDGWQPHVSAMASLLASTVSDRGAGGVEHSKSPAPDEGLRVAFRFYAPMVLWMDAISCVSTGQPPILDFDTWIDGQEDFDLFEILGCHNWVLRAIGNIGKLGHWTRETLSLSTFDAAHFNDRSAGIEAALETGLAAITPRALDPGDMGDSNSQRVTRIFALGALVQLAIIKREAATGQSSNSSLCQLVDRVIDEIQGIREALHVRRIPWVVCVTGCVAPTVAQRAFFETLTREALAANGSEMGNCKTVLEVLRRSWWLREQQPGQFWECGKTMRKMGICALLI